MSEESEANLPPHGGYGAVLTLNDIDKVCRHERLVFCKEDPNMIVGDVITERKMGWVGVSFSRDNTLVKCRSSHLIVLPKDNQFSKGDHVPSEYIATLPLKKPAPEPAAASNAVFRSQDRVFTDSTANINRAVTEGSDEGSVLSKKPAPPAASISTAVFRSQDHSSTDSTANINHTVTAEGSGSDDGSIMSRFSLNESSDSEVDKNTGNKRKRTVKAFDEASDSDESLFSVDANDEQKPPAKKVISNEENGDSPKAKAKRFKMSSRASPDSKYTIPTIEREEKQLDYFHIIFNGVSLFRSISNCLCYYQTSDELAFPSLVAQS